MVKMLMRRVGSAIHNFKLSEFKYTYYRQSFTLLSVVNKTLENSKGKFSLA